MPVLNESDYLSIFIAKGLFMVVSGSVSSDFFIPILIQLSGAQLFWVTPETTDVNSFMLVVPKKSILTILVITFCKKHFSENV